MDLFWKCSVFRSISGMCTQGGLWLTYERWFQAKRVHADVTTLDWTSVICQSILS